MPDGLSPYKRTPEFSSETVPAALTRDHKTKAGVWSVIRVLAGTVAYHRGGQTETLSQDRPGLVRPEEGHAVTPATGARFFVEFWR